MRKPVFRVVQLKRACSATVASESLGISGLVATGILSSQRATKVLIITLNQLYPYNILYSCFMSFC